jgi:hypothetical protein
MRNLSIGGEIISVNDAMKLVDTIYEHAYELAGQAYEKDRSIKFRLNWPNAYEYAEANKRNFIEQAREDFCAILSDKKSDEKTKKRVYLAILIERAFANGLEQLGHEADTRLQVKKNTVQFEGDKSENKRIMEKFGASTNLRADMLKSAAKISYQH